jgi:rhamnosyltransferase subunit B
MHIVMSCIGTYGDVLPQVAVGRTLALRGHDVEFLSSTYFRDMVEDAGLKFRSVMSMEDYLAGVRDPDVWNKWRGLRAGWRHISPVMARGFEVLSETMRPESVLTGSSMAFWVRMAEEKFGNPAVTIHLAPLFLMSAERPPAGVLPGLERLPLAVRRLVMAAADQFGSDAIMGPDVNRLRAQLGLAAVSGIGRRWMHAPQRVICAFPDWFCAPAADWPPNAVCTGFARSALENGVALPPALVEFCGRDSPPVVFTPGSGMGSSAIFFERAVEACGELGRRAVLITRFSDQLPAPLPDYAFHAAFADFDLLAPLAAAFVHPGGVGTTGLLMAAGTKQLFTPFALDQKDVASRAVALGVGLQLTPRAPKAHWVKMLGRLLDDAVIKERCGKVAHLALGARPGREIIADWVEALGAEPHIANH